MIKTSLKFLSVKLSICRPLSPCLIQRDSDNLPSNLRCKSRKPRQPPVTAPQNESSSLFRLYRTSSRKTFIRSPGDFSLQTVPLNLVNKFGLKESCSNQETLSLQPTRVSTVSVAYRVGGGVNLTPSFVIN